MEQYCCFKMFIPSTGGVCIDDNIRWFPHGRLKLTIPSNDGTLQSAINDLHTTLQSSAKKISYQLKAPNLEKHCLTLMKYSIIKT